MNFFHHTIGKLEPDRRQQVETAIKHLQGKRFTLRQLAGIDTMLVDEYVQNGRRISMTAFLGFSVVNSFTQKCVGMRQVNGRIRSLPATYWLGVSALTSRTWARSRTFGENM